MKNKYIKIISILLSIPFFILSFILGIASNNESYHLLDPHIDTEFAKDYTPIKFDLIKIGMSKTEVENIIGQPNSIYFEPTISATKTFEYTQDGKLNKNAEQKQAKGGDYAWYRSTLEYNRENKVSKIDKGWSYD
ncbi:MAG: hypothetical protein JNL75_12070 [Chitinophagales bacterium]|nr:hypothetical protein [Chitinophagales bacterium]